MNQESQAVPLAGPSHPRSDDVEFAASKPFWSPKRGKASKWLVWFLAGNATAVSVLLILVQIFLIARTPAVKIRSVTVTSLSYGNASAPSFNTTLETRLSLKNMNFGHFEYDNSNGRFYYMESVVGEMNIPTGRVGARKREYIDVTVELASVGLSENRNLSEDLMSGLLELRSRLGLGGGRVYLVGGRATRYREPEMNCLIALNLTARAVQHVNAENISATHAHHGDIAFTTRYRSPKQLQRGYSSCKRTSSGRAAHASEWAQLAPHLRPGKFPTYARLGFSLDK